MAPCTSNVAINSLKAYLSHNHLLPSSMEHDSGNETSQHQVSQCWCQIIKWLIIDAFQRKISIKREKCKRKIKMGSVLLRELSKMEPGGHWGSVMYTHVSLDGIWPFDHPLSKEAIAIFKMTEMCFHNLIQTIGLTNIVHDSPAKTSTLLQVPSPCRGNSLYGAFPFLQKVLSYILCVIPLILLHEVDSSLACVSICP